jgi:uncharacterized protein YyaL (SSP411 family)
MKNIRFFLTLLLLLTITNTILAQEVEWHNWKDGYKKAKEENKIILLDAYTEWCGWCKVMDQKTYTVKEVQDKIHENFVAIKLNPELSGTYVFENKSYSGKDLIKRLAYNKFRGYPTTFFVFPETGKSYMEIGYIKAEPFSVILDKYVRMK